MGRTLMAAVLAAWWGAAPAAAETLVLDAEPDGPQEASSLPPAPANPRPAAERAVEMQVRSRQDNPRRDILGEEADAVWQHGLTGRFQQPVTTSYTTK